MSTFEKFCQHENEESWDAYDIFGFFYVHRGNLVKGSILDVCSLVRRLSKGNVCERNVDQMHCNNNFIKSPHHYVSVDADATSETGELLGKC